MSDNNLSGKVGLDVTDYKAGVSELNRQIRVIESGFRASAAAMGEWDKNANGLELRTKALTSQIDLQKQKIAALTTEYQKVVAEKGADSRAAEELQIKLNKQNETLGKMTVELEQTKTALDEMGNESKDTGSKVQDLGDKQEQMAKKSESFKSALGGMVGGLKAALVAAAAVAIAVVGIAAGMAKMVMSSASAADNLAEMSAKTGISVQRLQELSYIGKQTGTDLDTVAGANAKLIRSMDAAASGTGAQAEAFRKLRVDATDGNGALRDSKVVFQEVLAKLKDLPNETERDAMAMALFGKSAQELNPLIKTSADEITRMTNEAHSMGAVMSDQAVAGLAGLNDMLDGLKEGLKGTLGEISAAFLPGFQSMAGTLTGYLKDLVGIVKGSNDDLNQIGLGKSVFDVANVERTETGLKGMASGIGGLLGKIVTDITSKLPEMLQGGLGIVQGVMDAVINSLPTMLPAVITMIQTLMGFIVQNIPILIDAGVQILLMLVTSLISMLPMLLTAAIEIIVQLANGLSAALPTLIPAVVGIIMQLVLTLVQNIPMLITAALQLIIALAQGLIAALPVLMDMLPTIMIELVNGLLMSLPQLIVAAIQIILTLGLGIIENIPKLLAMMPQVIDALVKEFKSDTFKVKIKSMGEDIVHGISEGFTKAWENFKANFMANWNELVDKVKDLLGIHSPSTVFAEIGVNMALGLSGGFARQMAGVRNQIEDAVNGFANSGSINANLNSAQNTANQTTAVDKNGKIYQVYFETYNESGLTRFLRQTEMLYGS